ncbi:PA2169 family four-helix-bundle protein [Thalassotalea sediminis]|uniref:PA2169 family four-helix-bundle protein n=1 Tax=Thalassotalea sediminis TaxID=1759089 RepID=UPI0025734CA6|nr:PA2169 family four-helix-bundle protein [Thalassotalea sediminis]
MSLSNYDMKPVKELIRVLIGGVEFYQEAKEQVKDSSLSLVFNKMITEKEIAIKALQTYVYIDEGKPEHQADTVIKLRESYTRILTLLRIEKSHTYLEQLEEVEDRVLEKVSAAVMHPLPAPCKSELLQIQGRMQSCHDEIKALQHITA